MWYFVLNYPNFRFLWFALLLIDSIEYLYTSALREFEKHFENCAGQGTFQPIYSCSDDYMFPDFENWELDGPTFCYWTSKYEADYHKAIYKCLTSTTWFGAKHPNYYIIMQFKFTSRRSEFGFQRGNAIHFHGYEFYCLAIIENSAGICESPKLY